MRAPGHPAALQDHLPAPSCVTFPTIKTVGQEQIHYDGYVDVFFHPIVWRDTGGLRNLVGIFLESLKKI